MLQIVLLLCSYIIEQKSVLRSCKIAGKGRKFTNHSRNVTKSFQTNFLTERDKIIRISFGGKSGIL